MSLKQPLENTIKEYAPSSDESERYSLIKLSAFYPAICDAFEADDIGLELCREGRN